MPPTKQSGKSSSIRNRRGVRKNLKSSPIVKIDEIAKKMNKNCMYELLMGNMTNMVNIKCSVGDVSSVGVGASENSAKLASAKALLQKIDTVESDQVPEVHPIDQLNQIAGERGWNVPVYEEQMSPSNHEIVVRCKLGDHVEEGTGLTKESAEFIAAGKMLELVLSSVQ